jgi:hypothetical protein
LKGRGFSRAASATKLLPALPFAENSDFGWRSVSTLR